MQVSHWRLMRELSWVMSKSHSRRKSQHELKWNTAQQVARIKYIWRQAGNPNWRQPVFSGFRKKRNDHEPLYPALDLHSKAIQAKFLPFQKWQEIHLSYLPGFHLLLTNPFFLLTENSSSFLLQLPGLHDAASTDLKKGFLGAVLIVFTILCCLPINSCQPEV